MVWLIVGGALLLVWIAMNLKTSRPDGTYLGAIHPYRRMMQFLMPTRNESVVYFDEYVNAEPLLEYLAEARGQFHVDVTHCVVAACGIGLAEAPKMNRFVVGRRLYQKKGRWITFSMKRRRKDKDAKISTVKTEVRDGDSFRQLVERIEQKIGVERSDTVTYTDKELNLFLNLPRPLLGRGVGLLRWLDYHNLLPESFLEPDPFFTSIFVANLGSVDMRAGYHHLYEWGTCPLFVMVGKVEDRPVVEGGTVKVQKTLHLRFSYDERIDDGMSANEGIVAVRRALESPRRYLGCLDPEGSDTHPLGLAEAAPVDEA
ncbi:MAG: 2-oxo acid dehydrogenase subunit E2 [Myxococcales bacterium]|nr:2-oxo acid dehydrogenase subunit E2 [Myxococcales bacterium]